MKRTVRTVLMASMLVTTGCSDQEVSYDPTVFNDYAISSSDYSTLNY